MQQLGLAVLTDPVTDAVPEPDEANQTLLIIPVESRQTREWVIPASKAKHREALIYNRENAPTKREKPKTASSTCFVFIGGPGPVHWRRTRSPGPHSVYGDYENV